MPVRPAALVLYAAVRVTVLPTMASFAGCGLPDKRMTASGVAGSTTVTMAESCAVLPGGSVAVSSTSNCTAPPVVMPEVAVPLRLVVFTVAALQSINAKSPPVGRSGESVTAPGDHSGVTVVPVSSAASPTVPLSEKFVPSSRVRSPPALAMGKPPSRNSTGTTASTTVSARPVAVVVTRARRWVPVLCAAVRLGAAKVTAQEWLGAVPVAVAATPAAAARFAVSCASPVTAPVPSSLAVWRKLQEPSAALTVLAGMVTVALMVREALSSRTNTPSALRLSQATVAAGAFWSTMVTVAVPSSGCGATKNAPNLGMSVMVMTMVSPGSCMLSAMAVNTCGVLILVLPMMGA